MPAVIPNRKKTIECDLLHLKLIIVRGWDLARRQCESGGDWVRFVA